MKKIALILLAGSFVCHGQRIFYNQDLDKQGQDTAAAAKQIASDSVTAGEIANLAVIEKAQLEEALQASKNTMRLEIQSFDKWSSVYLAMGDVTAAIQTLTSVSPSSADLNRLQDQIKSSAGDLKQAIQEKSKTAGSPSGLDEANQFLDKVVAHISDANDLLTMAGQIPGLGNVAGSKAVSDIEDGLKELDDLVKSAAAAFKAAKQVRVDPHSLMPSPEQLMVSVLAAEADSLKERIAIRARADLETGDVLALVRDTRRLMEQIDDCAQPCSAQKLAQSDRLISQSLAEGGGSRAEQLLMVLYQAASAAAQNQTPATVALIRESISWRRYEIRRNAIYNGSYEQAIQAAGQRLNAYYATGIKPNQIAQFLYYLSGIASLPAIAF